MTVGYQWDFKTTPRMPIASGKQRAFSLGVKFDRKEGTVNIISEGVVNNKEKLRTITLQFWV